MALRIDDELDRAITELAEKAGVSKQEAVRHAVLETGDRATHRGRIDGIARGVIEEYADALQRLGTV